MRGWWLLGVGCVAERRTTTVEGDGDVGGGVEKVLMARRWLRWRVNHGGGDVYGGGVVSAGVVVVVAATVVNGGDGAWR
ncbi:hypothetical protein Tco_0127982, partial [Tanacetum coccineum]